jgi:hypothetical protein
MKAAETDATKRALSTFGNCFGLSLYAGSGDLAGRRTAPAVEAANGQAMAHGTFPDKNGNAAADADEPQGPRERAPNRAGETHNPDGDARQPVDKSVLAIPELRRLRDKDHLRFVASHPCLVCGRQPAEAHHLKFAQPSALGRKVSDAFTVPLCALHHRDLHTTGHEQAWWVNKKIDPLPAADELWNISRGRARDEEARHSSAALAAIAHSAAGRDASGGQGP